MHIHTHILISEGEKELNKYGLSLERSRQIIMKGLDLFPLPHADPTTNETLLKIRADPVLMAKELSGGLVYEQSKEWVEAGLAVFVYVCVCVCAGACVCVYMCVLSVYVCCGVLVDEEEYVWVHAGASV